MEFFSTKLEQDTRTFFVSRLCFQAGRVLGSRCRSVLASTVSVRSWGGLGGGVVGRSGSGLVWSVSSVCSSVCLPAHAEATDREAREQPSTLIMNDDDDDNNRDTPLQIML